jgi:hypothetical protein
MRFVYKYIYSVHTYTYIIAKVRLHVFPALFPSEFQPQENCLFYFWCTGLRQASLFCHYFRHKEGI